MSHPPSIPKPIPKKQMQFPGCLHYDGRRLKELDPKRAAAFLIPFLAKTQPDGVRVKAIGALGWSSFHEAIPALSAIALDATDNEAIRAQALNPGLRYMKHPEALLTNTFTSYASGVSCKPSAAACFSRFLRWRARLDGVVLKAVSSSYSV